MAGFQQVKAWRSLKGLCGADFTLFSDTGATKKFEIDGATGDILTSEGHHDGMEFTANAFHVGDWVAQVLGVGLGAALASKKCWIPLNFLKIGDELVSYKLVGDVVEVTAVTLDCKLVRVNKADPLTTTDVAGGAITQVIADGNFDAEAVLTAPEVVATDKQYVLEILGSTSTSDAITVIGAEVKVNRKV